MGCLTISALKVSFCGEQLNGGSGNLGFISPLRNRRNQLTLIAHVSFCYCLFWLKSEFPGFLKNSLKSLAEFLGSCRTLEKLQRLGGRRCSPGLLFLPVVLNLSLWLLCLTPCSSLANMNAELGRVFSLGRTLSGQ